MSLQYGTWEVVSRTNAIVKFKRRDRRWWWSNLQRLDQAASSRAGSVNLFLLSPARVLDSIYPCPSRAYVYTIVPQNTTDALGTHILIRSLYAAHTSDMERVERLVRTWMATGREDEVKEMIAGAPSWMHSMLQCLQSVRDIERERVYTRCREIFGRISHFGRWSASDERWLSVISCLFLQNID